MLLDFLYSISNTQLLLVICSVFVALGVLAIALTNCLIGIRRAWEDSTAISAAIRPIASVFAVLVAFMAIAALSAFNKAKELVQREAMTISAIRHESEMLPFDVGNDIRGALKDYITAVVSTEWPLMRMGRADVSASAHLDVIYTHADQYQLQTNLQRSALDKVFGHVDSLFLIHQERTYFATESLPPMAWVALLGCGLLTIASVVLFEIRSPTIQYAGVGCVSLSVGLLVFVVFAFDNPFRGKTSVEPTPLLLQLQDLAKTR